MTFAVFAASGADWEWAARAHEGALAGALVLFTLVGLMASGRVATLAEIRVVWVRSRAQVVGTAAVGVLALAAGAALQHLHKVALWGSDSRGDSAAFAVGLVEAATLGLGSVVLFGSALLKTHGFRPGPVFRSVRGYTGRGMPGGCSFNAGMLTLLALGAFAASLPLLAPGFLVLAYSMLLGRAGIIAAHSRVASNARCQRITQGGITHRCRRPRGYGASRRRLAFTATNRHLAALAPERQAVRRIARALLPMRPAATLALLLALAPSVATAQADAPAGPPTPGQDRGWFAFGLGVGAPYGAAAAVTANLGRTRVLQVGYHANSELRLGGRPAGVNAFHIGGGLSRVSRSGRVAVTAGPAVVWGSRHEGTQEEGFTVGGVVLSAQVVFTPHPTFGLGLEAFVVANSVEGARGLALTLVIEGHK